MKLLNLMSRMVPRRFQKEQFIITSMAILNALDKKGQINTVDIEPSIAYRYEGNFYGLLKHLKIPEWQNYLTLQLNGLTDPVLFDGDNTTIKIISENALLPLVNQWK